jgi:hypothetical protein
MILQCIDKNRSGVLPSLIGMMDRSRKASLALQKRHVQNVDDQSLTIRPIVARDSPPLFWNTNPTALLRKARNHSGSERDIACPGTIPRFKRRN